MIKKQNLTCALWCRLLTSALESLSSQTEDSSDIIVKSGEFPEVVDSISLGVCSYKSKKDKKLELN